jgi:hypothetical protein
VKISRREVGALAIILVIGALVSGCSEHSRVHRALALRHVAIDGAGIGVVVDEMRSQGSLPISEDGFLKRYRSAFSISWVIRTNEQDLLELSNFKGIPIWSIDRHTGIVRLVGTADPEQRSVVSLFKSVDFSKPFSELNVPNLDAATLSKLSEESDFIRKYYVQSK